MKQKVWKEFRINDSPKRGIEHDIAQEVLELEQQGWTIFSVYYINEDEDHWACYGVLAYKMSDVSGAV